MPVIKIGGASKPAAKKSTSTRSKPASKPAAKRTNGSKPAAKKTTASKPAAKRAAPTPKVDPKVLKQFETKLERAGAKRKKAHAEHEAAVAELAELVGDAREAGVPMSIIADKTDTVRQWLYKMTETQNRNGGAKKKPASKPAAKTTTRKPANRTTASKSAAKKPAVRSRAKK